MTKKTTSLLLALLLAGSGVSVSAQQLAFPGAQGWGRFATGGRGGEVYHVTNLNDSGTGSLRDAISQPNRIIVFDVSGVINISSRLVFKNNLTIAGQTAPGEGITVYGNGVSFSGASNIIVRHMRFRMGKQGDSGKDCAGIANGTDMIFDHCSFSWGLDETFSINPDGKGTAPQNITISNTIMGQGLLQHSAGGLMQADNITLYRNLYCDNSTRNNKVKGIQQYVNNIVYNWKNGCYLMGGDSQGQSYVNVTNNLFINGPSGGGNAITSGNADFHIYAIDNWQDRNRNGVLDPYEIPRDEYTGGPTFEEEPFAYARPAVKIREPQSFGLVIHGSPIAEEAEHLVLLGSYNERVGFIGQAECKRKLREKVFRTGDDYFPVLEKHTPCPLGVLAEPLNVFGQLRHVDGYGLKSRQFAVDHFFRFIGRKYSKVLAGRRLVKNVAQILRFRKKTVRSVELQEVFSLFRLEVNVAPCGVGGSLAHTPVYGNPALCESGAHSARSARAYLKPLGARRKRGVGGIQQHARVAPAVGIGPVVEILVYFGSRHRFFHKQKLRPRVGGVLRAYVENFKRYAVDVGRVHDALPV